MRLELAITQAAGVAAPYAAERLEKAALAALRAAPVEAGVVELGLRLVDVDESATLNGRYRGKPRPTNVLSFTAGAELPGRTVLGDLIVCVPVVEREAAEQHKSAAAHSEHMVVHGVLHLLGHDHNGDEQAAAMEALESRVMAGLGRADPYRIPRSAATARFAWLKNAAVSR